jgi:hypothetical protein
MYAAAHAGAVAGRQADGSAHSTRHTTTAEHPARPGCAVQPHRPGYAAQQPRMLLHRAGAHCRTAFTLQARHGAQCTDRAAAWQRGRAHIVKHPSRMGGGLAIAAQLATRNRQAALIPRTWAAAASRNAAKTQHVLFGDCCWLHMCRHRPSDQHIMWCARASCRLPALLLQLGS